MVAGGNAVTPVDLQGTGITIPAGTPVRVELGGSITRVHTPGLVQFCALPHMERNCRGAWAEILRTTPFTPAGGDGPRAMVSWGGGDPVYPDTGTGHALAGPAGGELWAGRKGLQCWYVDHVTGIQGACFEFGGGYLATVSPRPTVTLGGADSGSVEATLSLSIRSSTVGPAGGSADLVLSVATNPDTAAAPTLGFTKWYFIPDSMRTETGTPVPSPFEVRASHVLHGASDHPVRLDAERVRLPDGRVVGSGIYVTDVPSVAGTSVGARAPRLSRVLPRPSAGPSPAGLAASRTTTSYPSCDGATRCNGQFDAPSGTFVISTTLGGVPVSASARIGVPDRGGPPGVQIVRAAGPNLGGSFTTRENQISLEAVASPGYDGSVGWEFVDDPEDDVDSPHVVAGQGEKTAAGIGQSAWGTGRWPAVHPGRLDQKAYRYIVRAHASYGGVRVYSDPVVLVQNAVDVIRQEFIDYDTPIALTPAPAAFTQSRPAFAGIYQHSPTSESGLGDYCVTGGKTCTTLVSDRLSPFLTWLQGAWKHQPLVVTSIFRNPVHHHSHSPRARNNSPHKYGTAVDYDVVGADKSRQQMLHWTALRNTGLRYPLGGVCAETWYLGTSWAGNHVHFDRRYSMQSPCPDTWKVYEAIDAQPSVSSHAVSAHDTLVAMLESGDFDTRFAAAGALAELPRRDLPAGYGEAALRQLDLEIARRLNGAPSASEEYGAYLLELARVVHRSEDAAAAPSLARLGIEVSLGIRRFVARYATHSIPALEQVWREDESLHADVIGTYGEMLRLQADSGWALKPGEVATIDRAFIRAVEGGAIGRWGVAFHAHQLGLVEFAPLLSILASEPSMADDPFGLVPAAAVQGSSTFRAVLLESDPIDLMRMTLRVQSSVCNGATGQRLGQCTALASELSNASRALSSGSNSAALAALEVFRDLLHRAAERGIFTTLEQRLLGDNALAITGKLN